ncbi:helix-turn-helix domain-containing protein [Gloeocapsa sp. PCC 73106]|uniref:helix-turn-helix domain-containing protein n=1 Tax=Gloeocapsa sp. PCC 73106 TaxID=102232 RepID=UPI0002AD189F|nr:helix-turn-helix domain-containing protein [Gloeocapsa sp. PCC 73106]ELR99051.1 hypothetical protein GLO73106DRAFT_00028960 [Gloeocapsa sp. PCC 73106]
MSGVVHIEIQESVEELESLVRQQSNPRLKERLQALYMIKNQGLSISAIAKILGRHRSTISFPGAQSHRKSLGTSQKRFKVGIIR